MKNSLSLNGKKLDLDKPRMDLIPSRCLVEMAQVLSFGANKYGDHNWRKGIVHSRLYAAALRHLTSYWSGESIDPESGLSHLAHAMTNLAMLIETPEYDDRYNREEDYENSESDRFADDEDC